MTTTERHGQHTELRPRANPATPRVAVYGLISRQERLLLIKRCGHDTLPGGPVHAGEPIERALRRILLDQIGATTATLNFCTVVEHGVTEPGQAPASEVAFLFDTTLHDIPRLGPSASCRYRWADDHDLSTLQPEAIQDALIMLSAENIWQAWRP